MTSQNKYIFEDDPLKQREYIKAAYAKILAKGGGVVVPEKTLEKYRGIYNDPQIKLAVAIRDFYKKNLQWKTVDVEIYNDIIEIGFGTDGRNKSAGNRPTLEKAATFEQLEMLIKNATYAYSEKNRKAEIKKTYTKYVPQFHCFVSNANVDGIDFPVMILIREMNLQGETRYRYYTHDFVKK